MKHSWEMSSAVRKLLEKKLDSMGAVSFGHLGGVDDSISHLKTSCILSSAYLYLIFYTHRN